MLSDSHRHRHRRRHDYRRIEVITGERRRPSLFQSCWRVKLADARIRVHGVVGKAALETVLAALCATA